MAAGLHKPGKSLAKAARCRAWRSSIDLNLEFRQILAGAREQRSSAGLREQRAGSQRNAFCLRPFESARHRVRDVRCGLDAFGEVVAQKMRPELEVHQIRGNAYHGEDRK